MLRRLPLLPDRFAALLTQCTRLLLLSALLAGCDRPPELQLARGHAQGTTWHIKWWSRQPVEPQALDAAFQQVFQDIDLAISTYRDDSWLARFNAGTSTDWQSAPEQVIALLGVARQVHHASGGCFDPTIAPLFRLWGFHDEQFRVPPERAISNTLAEVGLEHVHVDAERGRIRKDLPGLSIDLSAMGEGHTLNRLAAVLEAHGIDNYLVEMGGDLKARGHKPDGSAWRVGIQAPVPGQRRVQRIVTLDSEHGVTLDTSGTYQRFFDDDGHTYGHIIDARSGRPTTHDLVSASVFGHDAALSDAWATAMLCLGGEEGMQVARRQQLPVYLIERQPQQFISHISPRLEHHDEIDLARPRD
ncbi:thiamine biosynthesis lipoprotein [Kushneria sinocarnis]|uniref:FAD:protein FMN transferase n=1 Tax=Kushneria sinocarnis TaxID=595502 RepID=A0A420WZR6_9GAMM|nr:FAD:protein FMN transferase [Kushneria sinocarnis]RKR06858.1 thiamine biosynthesis lipoprotein [Kushneria sinocarnis]